MLADFPAHYYEQEALFSRNRSKAMLRQAREVPTFGAAEEATLLPLLEMLRIRKSATQPSSPAKPARRQAWTAEDEAATRRVSLCNGCY